MTDRTTWHITNITNITNIAMTSITGQGRVTDGHIMVLLLVGFTWSVAVLAIGGLQLDINLDIIVAIGTGERTTKKYMVTVSGFALVAIMAVERTRRVGVASCAILCRSSRIMVNIAGGLTSPVIVIVRIVAGFTIYNRLNLSVAQLAINTIGVGCSVMGVLNTTSMATDTAG